jgi:alkanesulfonate monooxygenase SsuD/methylene tetrahydromethanopterin reductase-like flavin-dependent oxidoreductase (luciferase family)
VPLYLGAVGPRNLELAGEIADGWLGAFFSPTHAADQLARVRAGRERAGHDLTGFDVAPTVPVVFGDDVEVCAAAVRPYAALYLGGMGSRKDNFYLRTAERMGHGDAARRVQELFLRGQRLEAAAAVPLELIDDTSLLGPPARIAERLHAFAEAGTTTIVVSLRGGRGARGLATMRQLAHVLDDSGLGA